jgi:transcriptional regulator with GAF, ATPase, and Fis domain
VAKTQPRDLDSSGGGGRPHRNHVSPARIFALAALESIETAVRDPRRLAASESAVRAAFATVRRTLREEPVAARPEPEPARKSRHPPLAVQEVAVELSALEAVLGRSPAWRRVLETVAKIARAPVAALLQGESGTGKELLARVIHRSSHVSGGPFVAVNCGALPGPLLEAELFGHTRGAFTGATTDRKGRFKQADGGTLFLDEIGEIPLELQPKLLRAVQSGEIQKLGQDHTEKVNVRILAATNRDLRQLANDGLFREDLYYRLAAIRLRLPPLRERSEEIMPLLEFFLERYSQTFGRPLPALVAPAQAALLRYPFPGNVRELENIAKHLVLLAPDSEATEADLPEEILAAPTPAAPAPANAPKTCAELLVAKRHAVESLEREFVRAAIARADGNISRAARETGMNRSYLQRLTREHRERDALP